jgi:Undecaprenyl-phosphate galactose phosphotransferase WbaP
MAMEPQTIEGPEIRAQPWELERSVLPQERLVALPGTWYRCPFAPLLVKSLPLLACDMFGMVVAIAGAVAVVHLAGFSDAAAVWLMVPLVMTQLVCYVILGLYPGTGLNTIIEFRGVHLANIVAHLAVALTLFTAGTGSASAASALLTSFLAVALVQPLVRLLGRHLLGQLSWWPEPVLIIGGDKSGLQLLQALRERPSLGLRPVGIVDDYTGLDDEVEPDIYLGPLMEIPTIAEEHCLRMAILAPTAHGRPCLGEVINSYARRIPQLLWTPNARLCSSLALRPVSVGTCCGVELSCSRSLTSQTFVKRLVDLTIALALLPLILITIAVIAAFMKSTSRAPIFYSQRRIGLQGRHFKTYKFRTMVPNADVILKQHLNDDPEQLAEWNQNHKLKNDPRVTRLGKILRKASLDELPQILNVLRGDMSIVGPRPIVDNEIGKYADRFEDYCQVLPGVTGLWQISGRNDTTYDERVAFDSFYVRNWSVWFDLFILYRTIRVVFTGDGAY